MEAVTITQISPTELQGYIRAAVKDALSGIEPNKDEPQNLWMNLEELCAYLPDRPAKQTVYGLVSERKIPHHKGAKKLRFYKPEIDEWLAASKRRTHKENAQAAEEFLLGKTPTKFTPNI